MSGVELVGRRADCEGEGGVQWACSVRYVTYIEGLRECNHVYNPHSISSQRASVASYG
jgi:hypothetical protein